MDDPFVLDYDESELKIAAEFLTNWLPFLTRDLCSGCAQTLTARIRSLDPGPDPVQDGVDDGDGATAGAGGVEDVTGEVPAAPSPKAKLSWADMAEDELEMEAEAAKKKTELPREKREQIRFANVVRKKDFLCLERVKGKVVNVLGGLEIHTGVFSAVEQNRIVDFVHELQRKGRNGELGEHTFCEPENWMRGKGRVTIQFGCCYNYAYDKEKNPPGILRDVDADPIPPLFKMIIKRLVRWHVLPPTCIPNSCIVNIYEPGDWIPPHIDSHDFVRPFCTISFLSECNIVFGSNLKIIGAGEFSGSAAIPLPIGSVLVLNGNGADVAKHCVPAVPTKRISITFRKMDESKHPFNFKPEPDLLDIAPLPYESDGTPKDVVPTGVDRKHEVRRPERVRDFVENKHHSFGPDSDFQERMAHEVPRRRTGTMPIRQGRYRPNYENYDSAEAEGSAWRAVRSVPPSESPGILPLPSSHQDDTRKPRRMSTPNDLETRDEHAPHRSSPDVLKPPNEPIMRIICMDNRRIVVKSNPDDKEGSSWMSPVPERGDSTFSRPRPFNQRHRRGRD